VLRDRPGRPRLQEDRCPEHVQRLDARGRPAADGDLRGRRRRPPPPGSPAAEVALLRIAQEALANVVRHSGARTARIELTVQEADTVLVVADDGGGQRPARPDPALGGIGGASMRERAAELGGTVTVGPGPGGTGTRVVTRIPR